MTCGPAIEFDHILGAGLETVGIGPGRNEPDEFDLVAAHLSDDIGEDIGRGHDAKGFIPVALDGNQAGRRVFAGLFRLGAAASRHRATAAKQQK